MICVDASTHTYKPTCLMKGVVCRARLAELNDTFRAKVVCVMSLN